MEGWVLLELKRALRGQHSIEVIVIKGVADYGDLSKGNQWQWTAAKAAMDHIHYCLEKSGGIEFSGKANVMTLSRITTTNSSRENSHCYVTALKWVHVTDSKLHYYISMVEMEVCMWPGVITDREL